MSNSALDVSLESKRKDILDECEAMIIHFEGKAHSAKRSYQIFKYSSVVLATSVAVLATVQSIEQWPQLQIVIPIVSSIAALATTLLAVTNTQEHWIQARSTQQKLEAERILFTQEAGIYSKLGDTERVRKFSEQFILIWSSGHKQWEKVIKPTK